MPSTQKAQEWLNGSYPFYQRKNTKELTKEGLYGLALEGKLSLDKFNNLKKLTLMSDSITDLDISDCWELEELTITNNKISNLDFLRGLVNPGKLKKLNISNNNFSSIDISFFRRFKNLEELHIGTNEDAINKENYNLFHGSLKHLEKMTNLKVLDIRSTDIDEGLRYLPASLEKFYYRSSREDAKVKKILEKLKNYEKSEGFIESEKDKSEKVVKSVREIIDRYKKEKPKKIRKLLSKKP